MHVGGEGRQPRIPGLQHVHRVHDGRALRRHRVRAPEPDDEHALHLPRVELAVQPSVGGLQDGAAVVELPHPLRQRQRLPAGLLVRGRPAAGHLQQRDAEAVHVGGRARPARVHQVRVHQRRAEPQHDPVPLRPRQDAAPAVEVLVEAALRDELVDEQEALAAVAPADELDQVAVPQLADDPDLRLELPAALRGGLRRQHLDGDVAVLAREAPAVDGAEAAAPELVLLGEVPRRRRHRAVGVPPRSHPFLEVRCFPGALLVGAVGVVVDCAGVPLVRSLPALLPPQQEHHCRTACEQDRERCNRGDDWDHPPPQPSCGSCCCVRWHIGADRSNSQQ
uniref:Uncharacterized protein n=1 Tax=Setaria italica TaxID=4555 RepID=K3ZJ55_SETIT